MLFYFLTGLQSGWTALHIAAMNGNKEVAQLLLQCGADKSAIDNVSITIYVDIFAFVYDLELFVIGWNDSI